MNRFQQDSCPLIKRLAEDMLIRNLAQATIDAYTYHARRFADFIEKPLDRATVEDVRNFQLYLIQTHTAALIKPFARYGFSTRTRSKCRGRSPWSPSIKRPKTLPTVLSRLEIDQLLKCTQNLKHRTFLMTLYATGLRLSEAAHLTVADIDSNRM